MSNDERTELVAKASVLIGLQAAKDGLLLAAEADGGILSTKQIDDILSSSINGLKTQINTLPNGAELLMNITK